jgi:hypothetical protein
MTHVVSEVQPIPVPSPRFSYLHVDLVGPLPTPRECFMFILTVTDRSIQWVQAIPLSSITADSCTAALVSSWVSHFAGAYGDLFGPETSVL